MSRRRVNGAFLEVVEAMAARARAGLPEPGEYSCSWCGGPTSVYIDPATLGQALVLARTLCPCCSPPGCPHRFADCPICHCSTAPTGTYASGGPYTRCDGPRSHPVAAVAP